MKRFLLVIFLMGCPGLASRVSAQDASSAAAVAERQEAEERYRHLNAAVEALQMTQESLQKKIRDLQTKVDRLTEELSKPKPKYGTLEDLSKLADKLKELDDKRQADKELILSKIEVIVKTLKDTPVKDVKPPPAREKPSTSTPPATEKGYEYTVQQGDRTLTAIIAAYNEEFKKNGKKGITLKQVLEANPGLNPNKMKIGQKIFIPLPE